jgi:hypothetical protein
MDIRNRASSLRWWDGVDFKNESVMFRGKSMDVTFVVCTTCRGRGAYVNPSIDSNGLTREDFEDDPDFEEDYRSGVFDIECGHCEGHKVIPAPWRVEDRKRIEDRNNEESEYQSTIEMEMYMGL